MKRIVLLNPTRIVVTALVGLVAFAVFAVEKWNNPPGDGPAEITRANELLKSLHQQYTNGVYRIDPDSPTQTKFFIPAWLDFRPDRVLCEQEGFSGVVYKVEAGHTTIKTLALLLPPLEIQVLTNLQRETENEQSLWRKVETAQYRLAYGNREILKAKAMRYFWANPDEYNSYLWKNHVEIAQRSFSVCTKVERVWNAVRSGVLAFVITAPLVWLALLFIAWVWYFLLDRLSEVSRAVRGKHSDDKT